MPSASEIGENAARAILDAARGGAFGSTTRRVVETAGGLLLPPTTGGVSPATNPPAPLPRAEPPTSDTMGFLQKYWPIGVGILGVVYLIARR